MGLALLMLLVHAEQSAAQQTRAPGGGPITVVATPIDAFQVTDRTRTVFGDFTYLGGFELASTASDFGGLSGIRSSDFGGRLLMIADNGLWIEMQLDQTDDGTPLAVAAVVAAPMLRPDGTPLIGSEEEDSEALDLDADGNAYVSFERRNRIWRYPLETMGLAAPPDLIEPLAGFRSRYNGGLETMVVVPDETDLNTGAIIGIAERPLTEGDRYTSGLILGGPNPGGFRYELTGSFRPTDADFLPDGSLLVLERSFSIFSGVRMRLVQISASSFVPGAIVRGDERLLAGFGYQLDNMEGLDVSQAHDGSTLVTLVSDNNRSLLQRTLLLRFRFKNR